MVALLVVSIVKLASNWLTSQKGVNQLVWTGSFSKTWWRGTEYGSCTHFVSLYFPVLLCWLFSCILSFCSTKQPLHLHLITTLSPIKEPWACIKRFQQKSFLITSLLLIGSDCIMCPSVRQVFTRLPRYVGPSHLRNTRWENKGKYWWLLVEIRK